VESVLSPDRRRQSTVGRIVKEAGFKPSVKQWWRQWWISRGKRCDKCKNRWL